MRYSKPLTVIATRGYRALIRLCPAQSAQDRNEMARIFHEALVAEAAARSLGGFVRFCLGAFADTLRVAAVEHLAMLRGRFANRDRPAENLIKRRGSPSLRLLVGQARFEMRSLRKTPLVTTAAILTVSLAVGLAATIFSAVYGILLRPLPFAGGERLLSVELAEEGGRRVQFEALDLLDFRQRQATFEGLWQSRSLSPPASSPPGTAPPPATDT